MKKVIPKLIGIYLNVLAWVAPRKAGQEGFNIFCSPQRTPIKDHQQRFLDSAEKSTLIYDRKRISVYRWGRGPKKVLFLHGWNSHSFRWKNYIEAFDKSEFTLYAFDAPGHGHSQGKYLNLPIYSLALETFLNLVGPMNAIVGHSMGSFTALYTFHRLGYQPVEKLVITATPGEVNEFVEYYRLGLGLSDRAIRVIRDAFLRNVQNLPEYYSAKKFAHGLSIPGLIIHDENDAEAPHRHAETIHKMWPGSRLITTHGLGHNLRSSQVVKDVTEFLGSSRKIEIPKTIEASLQHAN